MMKSILMGLVLTISTAVFADAKNAAAANKQIEFGQYEAIDEESGTIKASLDIRPDNTTVFTVSTPDFQMPAPGCNGTYFIQGAILKASVKCPTAMLPWAEVEIDLTNVDSKSIRSKDGARVAVVISALGNEANMFRLKIVNAYK